MLKSERIANQKKWFKIIRDWELSKLSASEYCKQFNLNLKHFYRYRSLYIKKQSPKKIKSSLKTATSLIPVKVLPDDKSKPNFSLTKPQENSIVEIKLPKLTINTSDKANVDFIYNLITRLTAC